ncbi:MAG: restriction endonuclease subunit S [Candidatus Omnitrophica bacterium]|nr:restriction endonuclease subunit S [Candidatus Omnitrophota bacterium]
MEYSVVTYKKLKDHDDWRWDGEFLCFEPRHNARYVYKPIGDVLKFSQYGISIDMNEESNGYKIYRMNEISNMFCDRLINKFADISKEQLKKFKLKDNDVLFNRTNSQEFVGRTGIFKKFSDEEIVFASYLIRVRPSEEEILPEYLTTFLNTQYGIQDAKRRARISINQSNINAEELKRVKIPILPMGIQKEIRDIFNQSFTLVNKSEALYFQAEQILLSELNLLNWKPRHRLSFVKRCSDTGSAGRIDAEYFQPMYEKVVKEVFKYKKGYGVLGDLVKVKDKNFTPKDDLIYKYIELANISTNGSITGFTEEMGKELPTRARRKVNTGDVIVSSIEGSLSSIALITESLNNALCSTGFYVIDSENINSETLLVFLKSKAGQLQLKKGCSGTILTAISKDELVKLIIPKITDKIQDEIKTKITEMYNTKALSNSLLNIAKLGVELAIEKEEKHAQAVINSELKKLNIR